MAILASGVAFLLYGGRDHQFQGRVRAMSHCSPPCQISYSISGRRASDAGVSIGAASSGFRESKSMSIKAVHQTTLYRRSMFHDYSS